MESNKGLPLNPFFLVAQNELIAFIKKIPDINNVIIASEIYYYVYHTFFNGENSIFERPPKITTIDHIKKSDSTSGLLIISPADPEILNLIFNKLKDVPNYKKNFLIIPSITAFVNQVF